MGTTMSRPTTARASAVSPPRTHAGSCWAARIRLGPRACGTAGIASVLMTQAPALEAVDHDEHGEGDDEQHDRDGRGLAVGELLEARHDQDGRDLRLVRHV